jgi:hypothetical protein
MVALRTLTFATACSFLSVFPGGCSRRPLAEAARAPDPAPAPAPKLTPPAPKAAPPAAPAAAKEAPAAAPAENEPPRIELPKGDLNHLNLEVTALEMLDQMRITRAQLEQLKMLAPSTSQPMPAPREVAMSPEFARTLGAFHATLVQDDDDQIAEISARLEKLREKESPEFDDVEIGDAARKHTPEFYRTLTARQVASYVADYADSFPDPVEKILDAFDDIRKLPGRDWEEERDAVAGQVGWLVAGLDAAAEEKVTKQVADLLNRVHGLKDEDYQAKRAELAKEAEAIAGNVESTEVIRHFVERSVAELLSNPRLAAAVEARLKKE